MRIHPLPLPLPLPPREEPARPQASRSGIALGALQNLEAVWQDGRKRHKRPNRDDTEREAAPDPGASSASGVLDITA